MIYNIDLDLFDQHISKVNLTMLFDEKRSDIRHQLAYPR